MSENQKYVLFSRLMMDTLLAMIVDQTEVFVPNKADGAVLLLQFEDQRWIGNGHNRTQEVDHSENNEDHFRSDVACSGLGTALAVHQYFSSCIRGLPNMTSIAQNFGDFDHLSSYMSSKYILFVQKFGAYIFTNPLILRLSYMEAPL